MTVIDKATFATEQEEFWHGRFGSEYIARNNGEDIVASNVVLFKKILQAATDVRSICEFGCNIGLNIEAIKIIGKHFNITAYEINKEASDIAKNKNFAEIINGTILEDLRREKQYDLTFTKGVLIHINPDFLENVYGNLYHLSKRYIMVCEYYNPTPVSVKYRNNSDRLFKRDFAGELIDRYNLTLIDYGFVYHRDKLCPQDDLTWFLLEK
jgi:pseudaminic acid biosynthesis-associated methylase